MRFAESHLKYFLEHNIEDSALIDALDASGLEVDEYQDNRTKLGKFVVAEVISVHSHPGADNLKLCNVYDGYQELQIVCGATNVRSGIKIVLAQIGAVIPNGDHQIKKSKIRGEVSHGMLCSGNELDISEDSDGILELNDGYKIGDCFFKCDRFFKISITPNRGDALSVLGIARNLYSVGIGRLLQERIDINKNRDSAQSNNVQVSIRDERCTSYSWCCIKNIKNDNSPQWLQDEVQKFGCKSISVVVDIANYIMMMYGQPMHVYDLDKIVGDIVIRSATHDEKFHGLDGKEYCLKNNELVVTDDANILGIAGILGGIDSACTKDTTNILIEAAVFCPTSVFLASRKNNISTESSHRFVHGINQDFQAKALCIAIDMLQDVCQSIEISHTLNIGKQYQEREIKFRMSLFSRIAGFILAKEKIHEILSRSGFILMNEDHDIINVIIPAWRNDITDEINIVEEIIRVYGIDNINAQPMMMNSVVLQNDDIQSKISQILRKRGMHENVSLAFGDSKIASKFGCMNPVIIQNPIHEERDTLIYSMLPNFVEIAQDNSARGIHDVSLFEIGMIYHQDTEELMASGMRYGYTCPRDVHKMRRKFDFFDIKGDFINAMSIFNIGDSALDFQLDVPDRYMNGRSATVELNGKIIGYCGELKKNLYSKIKSGIFCFELYLNRLSIRKIKKRSIMKYQKSERDFAFLVDRSVTAFDIIKAIQSCNLALVSDVKIFDIYEGDKIPHGKKSIAVNVIIQPKDKNVTNNEIRSIESSIEDVVYQKLCGVLR